MSIVFFLNFFYFKSNLNLPRQSRDEGDVNPANPLLTKDLRDGAGGAGTIYI
jgi:hypothetical protein